MKELYAIISEVEGFESLYWGYNLKDSTKIELLCSWTSKQHQDAYPTTPQRKLTDPLLMSMSTTIPKCHYLSFTPSALILSSPVVEMLSLTDLPASTTASAFNPLLNFIRGTEGCLGAAAGEVTTYGDVQEGGMWFLVVVGWESKEANDRGAKSEEFKKLPKLEGKVEKHHVKLEKAG